MGSELFVNESEFVRWLRARSRSRPVGVGLGIGDDAAVVRMTCGRDCLLTTDLCIEGVHFLSRWHPARAIGHRALARSLSDVAAMGGTPRFALVSVAISRRTSRSWVEAFYAGMGALARRSGVAVMGGDTAVVTGKTLVDVIVIGEASRGQFVTRSGARPGDGLFVSGRLGLSALGLRLIRKGEVCGRLGRQAVKAHLYPEPRLDLGRYLASRRLASSLMDLSDGLSTDLSRLCQASGVGAQVWAAKLPAVGGGGEVPLSPQHALELALHGGEDYELLFTIPRRQASKLPSRQRGLPLNRIGLITRRKEILLVLPDGKRPRLEPGGYDHFQKP